LSGKVDTSLADLMFAIVCRAYDFGRPHRCISKPYFKYHRLLRVKLVNGQAKIHAARILIRYVLIKYRSGPTSSSLDARPYSICGEIEL